MPWPYDAAAAAINRWIPAYAGMTVEVGMMAGGPVCPGRRPLVGTGGLGDLHGGEADLGQFLVAGEPAADADAAHNDAVGGADDDAADARG